MRQLDIIDSHTEGEPTRVVIGGAPDLDAHLPEAEKGDAAARLQAFRRHYDNLRAAVVLEPRGFEALVGALLLPPKNPAAAGQMIFFNNADTLQMCGHGTIGVVETLAHLGRIGPGRHLLESPVGDVEILLHDDGSVSVDNVFSYRHAADVAVETECHGVVRGDVAWGGNWFFLVGEHGEELSPARIPRLLELTADILRSLGRLGVTGRDGAPIDHVELFAPPTRPETDSQNFVLCPGGEYDRCPCGTGTSAKLACLVADGQLAPGAPWRQEGILGTYFTAEARAATQDGLEGVLPTLTGRAWITAEGTLRLDPEDPFVHGIRR